MGTDKNVSAENVLAETVSTEAVSTVKKKPSVIITLLKVAGYVVAYFTWKIAWLIAFATFAFLQTKSILTDYQWEKLGKDPERFTQLLSATLKRSGQLNWYRLLAEPAFLMLLAGAFFGIGSRLIFDGIDLLAPKLMGGWMSASAFYNFFISDNTTGLSAILTLAAAGLCVPVLEEVIFRGLSLRHVKRIWPFAIAVVAVSVIFGMIHVGNTLLFILMIAVWCGILCILADRAGSILPTILAHVIFNVGTYSRSFIGLKFGKGTALWMFILGIMCIFVCIWAMKLAKKEDPEPEAGKI